LTSPTKEPGKAVGGEEIHKKTQIVSAIMEAQEKDEGRSLSSCMTMSTRSSRPVNYSWKSPATILRMFVSSTPVIKNIQTVLERSWNI